MDREVARGYECVDAYTTAHNVVLDFVDERVLGLGLREYHVRVSDRFQRCAQQQLLVEQI